MVPPPLEPDEYSWRLLAQVAIERRALLHRVARSGVASSTADLHGAGEAKLGADIDALLVALTGSGDGAAELPAVTTIRERMDPLLAAARTAFFAMLELPVPFSLIAANARLDEAEAEALALIAGCELDARLARLVAFVQDETGGERLSLQTLDQLLRERSGSSGDAGRSRVGIAEALGLDSQLRRSSLIDVREDGPWAQHAVIAHPGVIWALVGDTAADPDLPLGTVAIDAPTGRPVKGARNVTIDDNDLVGGDFVVVTGPDRIRRREEATRRATATRFLVTSQPADRRGWEALVREATLSGNGIVIELDDDAVPELNHEGRRIIARASHLAWAITSRRELAVANMPARQWVEFTASADEPDADEWAAAVGGAHGQVAGQAAGQIGGRVHRLSASQLDLVSRAYVARHGDLDGAVRRLVSGNLEQLAQRIRPAKTWDDIVLTPTRFTQLHGIVDRYRHSAMVYDEWGFQASPSRGLVSLFSGPSGTGKTLAAEVIAGDLGLDVFKLDLSSVVSKYIGETEKNLEQIFDAAGGSNVVLFFDEADALFGKRSEVKDARDRYANIEVSYLLQRLERYDGVVLLATNFEKNIDEAFLRRIHTRVEFVIPAEAERRVIWARNFPPGAPIDGVDLEALAQQFEMSGGSIRNAAIHAAFLAAASDSSITMELTVRAIAREMRKMGRLLKREHFGQWFDAVSSLE
jgi:AAA+ superfamily predicted ATPase